MNRQKLDECELDTLKAAAIDVAESLQALMSWHGSRRTLADAKRAGFEREYRHGSTFVDQEMRNRIGLVLMGARYVGLLD